MNYIINNKIRTVNKFAKHCINKLFPFYNTRPMFNFICNNCNTNGGFTGAELGVYKGENAFNILNVLKIKKLYLVDPYTSYTDNSGIGLMDMSVISKIAQKRLGCFDDKIIWIKKPSSEAYSDIPNDLSFVYIDDNHNYDYVKQNIHSYFPKIKVGGVFGGDDYKPKYPGVIGAVDEFIDRLSYDLFVENDDWWILKK